MGSVAGNICGILRSVRHFVSPERAAQRTVRRREMFREIAMFVASSAWFFRREVLLQNEGDNQERRREEGAERAPKP